MIANFLMVAAILSQAGGSLHTSSNHTDAPALPYGTDGCFLPSCAQKDWAKANLQIGSREGKSVEWCTRVPQDKESTDLIGENMQGALASLQDQAASSNEQLTEAGVVASLEAVMKSYCEFVGACQGEPTCTWETRESLRRPHRYGNPLTEKRKGGRGEKGRSSHTSHGRGGR